MQMPGMDGLEALKAKKPEIQVILLTGHVIEIFCKASNREAPKISVHDKH